MSENNRAAKAVEFLIDSAAEFAAAKADVIKTEHMVKVAKAMAMRASEAKTIAAQDADALCSPAYQTAVTEYATAEQAFTLLRAQREAAIARIEYWRSLNANQRAAERGFGSAA